MELGKRKFILQHAACSALDVVGQNELQPEQNFAIL